jgi:hypothetical protein
VTGRLVAMMVPTLVTDWSVILLRKPGKSRRIGSVRADMPPQASCRAREAAPAAPAHRLPRNSTQKKEMASTAIRAIPTTLKSVSARDAPAGGSVAALSSWMPGRLPAARTGMELSQGRARRSWRIFWAEACGDIGSPVWVPKRLRHEIRVSGLVNDFGAALFEVLRPLVWG